MNLIPENYMQELKYKIFQEGTYDDAGNYIEGKNEINDFKGAILPLNERDMQCLPEGTYSIDDMKLYTYEDLKDNTVIEDINGNKYKIYANRKYGIISEFKRYFMKKESKING